MNLFKVNKKDTRMTSVDVVLLLLTWNISDILFHCFCCWLWARKYRLPQQLASSTEKFFNLRINLSIANWYDKFSIYQWLLYYFSTNNYLFKVNIRNTRTWWEICSKLTIKMPARCQWLHSGLLFTLYFSVSVVDSEQVITVDAVSFKWIVFYVWLTSDDRFYLIS